MALILNFQSGAPLEGRLTFTAQPASTVQGRFTFAAEANVPLAGRMSFRAASLLKVPTGQVLHVTSTADIQGAPGKVLSWEYNHTGVSEELRLVVHGLHGMATPAISIQAWNEVNGTRTGILPLRAFSSQGQEPQESRSENTTTFWMKNSFDQNLRGIRLAEKIQWKLVPGRPCDPRRRVYVSSLVGEVMRGAGPFTLEEDPLAGQFWEENRADYSTAGKTPQQVWDETYGLLGMQLHLQASGSGNTLVGRFPVPRETGATTPPDPLTLSREQQRQWRQTPGTLTVLAGDLVRNLDKSKVLGWLGSHPAAAEVDRELSPNAEWQNEKQVSGTSVTQGGKLKSAGRIIAELEFTTDDLTVKEMVNGQEVVVNFGAVLMGDTYTTTQYDPECPVRPISQKTIKRNFGYAINTELHSVPIVGPGFASFAMAGDLVHEETQLTTYVYSPQGFLLTKTVSSSRTGSVQQTNAEDDPKNRGPLQGREVLRDTLSETWMPIGGGLWYHTVRQSTQSLVPVYDADSQEAVRTNVVTRSLPPRSEATDQAPPSYDCTETCKEKVYRDQMGVVLRAGDAGFAEPREVNLPFVTSSLISIAQDIMRQDWNRIVTTMRLAIAAAYWPGVRLADGQVQSLRISQAENSEVIETEIECLRQDTLLGAQPSVEDYMYPAEQGRAIMLAGEPGGVLARLTLGWSAGSNSPIEQKAYLPMRSGFPPRPGDELDWQVVNGRREVVNSRG